MAGGWGPPILDFSPIGNLANTFFDAQDRSRKRKLEDLQLQAGDEWAKSVASQLDTTPGAPAAPAAPSGPMSLASLQRGLPGNDKVSGYSSSGYGGDPYSGDDSDISQYLQGQDKELAPILKLALKDSGNNWNALTYGGKAKEADLEDMTLAQVYDLQSRMPSEGHASTALGGGQFIHSTLKNAADQLGLDPNATRFDRATQLKIMAHLARSRGYDDFKAGKLSPEKYAWKLAQEWAILPKDASGRGFYDGFNGNKSGVAWNDVMAALRSPSGGTQVASADAPAPGARNAQFQIPGQAPQAQSPQAQAPAGVQPPQIQIPAYIRQGLQSPNPYVRQKAAEVAQKYIAQRQELAVEQWKTQENRAYEGQVREQTWNREDQIRAATQQREDRIREQTWSREDENRFQTWVREDEKTEKAWTREDVIKSDDRDYAASQKREEREANRFEIQKGRNGATVGIWDKVEQRMLSPEELQRRGITPQQAGAAASTENFDDEEKLRGSFHGLTKDYREIEGAFTRMKASYLPPVAPGEARAEEIEGPADIALIFNYMKMLDPGSVVREGEFATAQNSGGVGEKIQSLYNGLLRGGKLSPNLRKEILARAESIYGAETERFNARADEYRGLAQSYGFQPDRITQRRDVPARRQPNNGQGGTNLLSPQPLATQGGAPVPSGVFNWQPGQGLVPAR